MSVSPPASYPIPLVQWLLVVVTVCLPAQLVWADGPVAVDGADATLTTQEPGTWRLSSGDESRALAVPPGWQLDGTWSAVQTALGDGAQVTELSHTTQTGQTWAILFHGTGDLLADTQVWAGGRNDLSAGDDVFVDDIDQDGGLDLVHRSPQGSLPDCGQLTEQLLLQVYDGERFVPLGSTQHADTGSVLLPRELQTDDPTSLFKESLLRSFHRFGRWEAGARKARTLEPAVDGNLATSIRMVAGDVIVIRPFPAILPDTLVLSASGTPFTMVTEAGDTYSVQTSSGQSAFTWPEGSECVLLEAANAGELSDLSLLTELDRQARDVALKDLLTQVLDTDDRARVLALSGVLARAPEYLEDGLVDAARAANTRERFNRILLIANVLPHQNLARVALELAGQPAAPADVVEKSTAILRRFPDAAAFSLRRRLEGLKIGTKAHLEAATMLATLPAEYAELGPLLNELDQRSESDAELEPVLAALGRVDPGLLVPTISGFVGADGMREATRMALLRALLRVPAGAVELSDPDAVVALTTHDSLAMRLLALQVAEAWKLSDVAESARTSMTSEVDVERAIGLRALTAALGTDAQSELLTALHDEWPSVRMVAAATLAREPFLSEQGTVDALRKAVDTDPWPGVRGPALTGLARAGHQDAVSIAASWLNDPEAEIALRQLAAEAAREGSLQFDWKTIRKWVESPDMLRSTRRNLLLAWMSTADPPWTQLEAAIVEWASATEDVDLQRLASTALSALVKQTDQDLSPLLTQVYDATNDTLVLRQRTVELMARWDEPEVRERLADAVESEEEALAEAARRSLDTLDGETHPLETIDPFDGQLP